MRLVYALLFAACYDAGTSSPHDGSTSNDGTDSCKTWMAFPSGWAAAADTNGDSQPDWVVMSGFDASEVNNTVWTTASQLELLTSNPHPAGVTVVTVSADINIPSSVVAGTTMQLNVDINGANGSGHQLAIAAKGDGSGNAVLSIDDVGGTTLTTESAELDMFHTFAFTYTTGDNNLLYTIDGLSHDANPQTVAQQTTSLTLDGYGGSGAQIRNVSLMICP